MRNNITIRPATRQDTQLILFFIKQLADYERMTNDVVATPELLEEWIFDKGVAKAVIAEYDGDAAGFALYFHNFSTFLGRAGIYLEDLFVLPNYRRKGIGKAVFNYLASLCVQNGYGRLEWSCLDWNYMGIDFYNSIGAVMQSEWRTFRLTGDALANMAKGNDDE